MKDLKVDEDMLYPAGIQWKPSSPDEVEDILYPPGVGENDDDEDVPLMDE